MKHKSLYRLPVLLGLVICVAVTATIASAGGDYDSEARRNKAELYMSEGLNAYYSGEYDRYIRMLARAYELDSTNTDIAAEWAFTVFASGDYDSVKLEEAYESMRRNFMEYPRNYFNGVRFANLAREMGRLDDAVFVWTKLDSLFPKREDTKDELARIYLHKFSADSDTAAFAQAIDIYNAMELGGKSINTVSNKIQAYALADDTVSIIRQLNDLDSIMPNDNSVAWFIGSIYEHLNRTDEALAYYDKACMIEPTDGRALQSRAEIYLSRGDTLRYDEEIYRAIKDSDLDRDDKLRLTQSYVVSMMGDSIQENRAIDLLNTVQEMYPGDTDIPDVYSMYLTFIRRIPQAIEQTRYAMTVDPDNESLYTRLAILHTENADTLAAISTLEDAIGHFKGNLEFPTRLSLTYVSMGNNAKAVEVLDSVVIDPEYPKTATANFYSLKGDILAGAGDTIRALETYDLALEYDPDQDLALNNAAYFMAITGGDLDKAERYILRALKDNDLNTTYLDTYAWVLYLKKDYVMAKMYIDITLNGIKEAAAEIAAGEDDGDESEAPAIEASDGGSADIYDHAGDIYFVNGYVDEAVEYWKKALELDPENKQIEKKVKNKSNE